MKPNDKLAFGETLIDCMTFYDIEVKPALLAAWFAALQPHELAAVQAAFGRYVTDPKDCRFQPKPGDIIRHLPIAAIADDATSSET